MITLNPGKVPVLSVRALVPFRGVPIFDLQLDPDIIATVPTSGKVVITIGQAPDPVTVLVGTIDPRGSGPFASTYAMRVLGGGAGWDQPVTPQHYQHDGGVPNQEVYATTATLVGEAALVLVPAFLGTDFVRTAGPASRVLDGERSWWVDVATGVTTIGPRPPAVPDKSLALMTWDPGQQRAELVCDVLVMPGTPITDTRIGSAPVVARDVEQFFDSSGSRVTAWCGASAATELANDLRAMVEEFSGIKYARSYLARIILQSPDGRLALQAVHKAAGIPDTVPITPWSGVAGASCKHHPGATVRVAFVEGDPSQPIADSYAPGVLPVESTYDASLAVHVGPSALRVALAGGVSPLVMAGPYSALLGALVTFATGLTPTTMVAQAAALVTAIGSLPPPATTKTVAA